MCPYCMEHLEPDYRFVQPNPIANGKNYYFYDDSDPGNRSDRFKTRFVAYRHRSH